MVFAYRIFISKVDSDSNYPTEWEFSAPCSKGDVILLPVDEGFGEFVVELVTHVMRKDIKPYLTLVPHLSEEG